MRHGYDSVGRDVPRADAFFCHVFYSFFNVIHCKTDVVDANARIQENILEMLRDRLDQFEGQTVRVEKGKSSVSGQVKWRNDADVFILQVEQALKIRDRLLQVADDVSDVAEGTFWFHKKEERGKKFGKSFFFLLS
jgi:hypothetical protein